MALRRRWKSSPRESARRHEREIELSVTCVPVSRTNRNRARHCSGGGQLCSFVIRQKIPHITPCMNTFDNHRVIAHALGLAGKAADLIGQYNSKAAEKIEVASEKVALNEPRAMT